MSSFVKNLRRTFQDPIARMGGVILAIFMIMAIFAPQIAPYGPYERVIAPNGSWVTYASPSWKHPLGTTGEAYDIFSQLVYSTRLAFMVGILTAMFVAIIGTIVGLVAGYYKGWLEEILMRITDVAYGIPFLPFAILLVVFLGHSVWNIVLAVSILLWRETARVVRSEVLTIREKPMIEAARMSGAKNTRIMFSHIGPQIIPTTVLYAVFAIGWAILNEAGISFLGFGDPYIISWGRMLHDAFISQGLARGSWWWFVFPGLCIIAMVVSVYFIGQGLEEVVNPRLRERGQ